MNQMESLLKDWGFEDLLPHFKEVFLVSFHVIALTLYLMRFLLFFMSPNPDHTEHQIDDLDDLGDLIASPSHFEKIVPKIGLRFKITRKYQAELQTQSSGNEERRPADNDSVGIPTVPEHNNPNPSLGPVDDKSGDCQSLGKTSDPDPEPVNENVPEQGTTNKKHQAEVIIIESESPAKKRRHCRTQDFDVKQVLEGHPLGQCIIIQYNVFGYLESIHQLYLVQIIALELLRVYGTDLTDPEIEVVAEKIHNFIKSEAVATYFVPAILKKQSSNNESVKSRGKLRDKYKNWITFITRHENFLNIVPVPQQLANVMSSEISESALELAVAKKNELKTEKDPAKRKSLWDDSYILRVEDRKNGEFSNGTQISNTWPNLKDEDAFVLLASDFYRMYPKNFENLRQLFDEAFAKILPLFKVTSSTSDDKKLFFGLLKSKESFSNLTEDHKTYMQLEIMSSILVPKNVRIEITQPGAKKKKFWKPNSSEARKGIVTLVKTEQEIPSKLMKRTAKLVAIKQPPLPFIVAVGDDVTQLKKFYVRVDGNMYEATSLFTALDMLMKIFFALNINYPVESENVLSFLQMGLYQISRQGEKLIPAVINVLNRLKLPCQMPICE
ncbi:hypothetical protein QAD02_013369 [Eretmocerus hayati]|uniref:Uncharacterized protein n=1 Tax=Eretmocerus hayati TaxID=131215 RepID=A0ACC2P2I2_9HYME|nr:hypothetical protein QAD02_013369 [Eretmocerus hayati]